MPEPLAATAPDPFSGVFVLRGHPSKGHADSHLVLFRRRYVGRGMREDLEIENYGEEAAFCSIELLVDADFADLFEVKEGRVHKQGQLDVSDDGSRLTFRYKRHTFERATHVDFSGSPRIHGNHVVYETVVPPRGSWSACIEVTPGDRRASRSRRATSAASRSSARRPVARLEEWRARMPVVTSDDDQFRALLERSTRDLAGPAHLRPRVSRPRGRRRGRAVVHDAVRPRLAAHVVDDDARRSRSRARHAADAGAVPGPARSTRAPRRSRAASCTRCASARPRRSRSAAVASTTAPSTPRRCSSCSSASCRAGASRREEVDALLPAADAALAWITEYGDRDGDGYVEYQRTTDRGLQNQGWKDSWDSMRFADGSLAAPPIALCEVQGYVYAALDRARPLRDRGRRSRAAPRR